MHHLSILLETRFCGYIGSIGLKQDLPRKIRPLPFAYLLEAAYLITYLTDRFVVSAPTWKCHATGSSVPPSGATEDCQDPTDKHVWGNNQGHVQVAARISLVARPFPKSVKPILLASSEILQRIWKADTSFCLADIYEIGDTVWIQN